MDNVKVLKLVTGDDILAQVETEGLTHKVKLVKPMLIGIRPEGLSMSPMLILANTDSVWIDQDKIVMQYTAKAELAAAYQQQVTGIVTAPASTLDGAGKLIV